ncbi:hypothetical protein C0J52_08626 [Blattella germanica]|nr:hypothetical protein C0J52_08626 [Blattella germanica]
MESDDIKNLKSLVPRGPSTAEFEEYENEDPDCEKTDDLHNDDEIADIPNPYLDLDQIHLDRKYDNAQVCISLGAACRDILHIIEKQLITLLEKYDSQLKDIQEQIEEAKYPATKVPVVKKNWYFNFGIPYFKDHDHFHCPLNSDHFQKRATKELVVLDLPPLRQWRLPNKLKLECAIKNEEISNRLTDVEARKQAILNGHDYSESAMHELQMLNECNLIYLTNKSLAELVCSESSRKEYDWMKISAQDLQGHHTPDECRAMWHNYLHPKIKKTKWSTEEDNKLIELANKYNNQNWDAIANELGTQRSGYQCMCQYQTRLNDSLKKSKWTSKEDEYLTEVVESCRIGSYIPWAQVTMHIEGRSKSQVFNRWTYSLDPTIKRGRFTKHEDILVVAAVRRYGTDDFKRVARFVPGRTSIQVRDRYNGFLKLRTYYQPWTQADDSLLMSLVEMHGVGNWSKISESFENRTRTQIRHRYTTIMSWMRRTSEDKGITVPTRKLNVDPCREVKVWNKVQNILQNMKSSTELNESSLLMLKEKFDDRRRKRPGRKIGQKKPITELDEQFHWFFQCVYAQSGGRKKIHYDESILQHYTDIAKLMLMHLQANIFIPKQDKYIDNEIRFDSADRIVLRKIRDENRLSRLEESNPREISGAGLLIQANPVLVGRNPSSVTIVDTNIQNGSSSLIPINFPPLPFQIPLHCPPNHTTLVGFRTLLLSRRRISVKIDDDRTGVLDIDDFSNTREENDSSDSLSPDTAHSLWSERLISLFLWPAVMSNIIPSNMEENLFVTENPCTSSGIKEENIETTNEVNNTSTVKRKTKRIPPKKRKLPGKKKESENLNLPKKRKYEKTGKFKRPAPSENEEPRRSARCKTRNKNVFSDDMTEL